MHFHRTAFLPSSSSSSLSSWLARTPIEGRLKVCASCLVFDPKDYSYPIYSVRKKQDKAIALQMSRLAVVKSNPHAHLLSVWGEESTASTACLAPLLLPTWCRPTFIHMCSLPHAISFPDVRLPPSSSHTRILRSMQSGDTRERMPPVRTILTCLVVLGI